MAPERALVFEQHLEEPEGPTVGWLVRYGLDRALWCGELSREAFRAQPAAIRSALRDDFGWFLVDVWSLKGQAPLVRVLGKAACERTAFELLSAVLNERLGQVAALDRVDQRPVGRSVIKRVLRKVASGPNWSTSSPAPDGLG